MVRIAEESLKRIEKIRKEMITERRLVEAPWSDVTKKINPLMDDWDDDSPPSRRGKAPNNMADIHNNEVIKASNKLADGIMSYAFSRSNPWFRTAYEPGAELNKDWLQYAEDHSYTQFSRSSFYDAGRQFVKTGADYATAVMFKDEDYVRGLPVYTNLHIKRVYLAQDRYGNVDVLFYKIWLKPEDAAAEFGVENLPERIKTAYHDNSTKEFLFWHHIFPFSKYDLDIGGRENKTDIEFYSLHTADCEPLKAIKEKHFRRKPFYGWRWSRSLDGGVWGTDSPGLIEISNVNELNGMSKDFKRIIQLQGRPPIKATEGLKGRIKFVPSGRTYLNQGEDFIASKVVGDLQGIVEGIDRHEKSINESYMTEFFLVLTRNIERAKTATEVEGLQGEQAALLSAFYGRLVYEFLEPAVEDMIESEIVAGRLDVPYGMQGKEIKIDMVSPLSQIQKRKLRLATTDQGLREIIALSEFRPEILDNFDFDEYARVIAETYDMNKKIVIDLVDVERRRLMRARQEQAILNQQMEIEQGTAEADAYNKLAKAPEKGSAAEKAIGANNG